MKKIISYVIVWFIALAVIAGALLLFESNLLWKLQEMNLFWLMLEYHALIEIAQLLFKDVRIHKMTVLLLFFCLPPVFTTTRE